MKLRGWILLLFLFSLSALAELTEDEKRERQRVLDEFASQQERDLHRNAGQNETEDSKNSANSINTQNLKNGPKKFIPNNAQLESVIQDVPVNNANTANVDGVDSDLENAQQGGEVLDPDKELESLNAAGTNIKMPDIDPSKIQEMLKNMEGNPLMKMLPPEHREAAVKMMQQNPFQSMGKEAVKGMILNKMDPKKPAGKFLHESPKLVDFAASWVVDDKAIPAFISIIAKKDKAKIMGGIVVAVFITVFLLNLKNSKQNLFKRIMFKLAIMLGSAIVNFGAFYIIYKEELGPTVDLALKYF